MRGDYGGYKDDDVHHLNVLDFQHSYLSRNQLLRWLQAMQSVAVIFI